MESVFGPVLLSVIVGLITIILGNIAVILSRRKMEEDKQLKKHTKNLVGALSAQAELTKAKALKQLSEKLPDTSEQQEFLRNLNELVTRGTTGAGWDIRSHDEEDAEDAQGWALVQNLVDGYHRQALDQARIQFWFSVTAATVGFVWIIYTGEAIDAEQLSTSFKTFPGIVIETVAFLFFRQAEATRQRATELYDRLRDDNRRLQAIALVESVDDPKVRSAVKAQLALHMAGLSTDPIDLNAFVEKKKT